MYVNIGIRADTGAVWKIISKGIINHSALLTNPILTPIITPPIIVIHKPVRRGGKLSAYALMNSPEFTIDPKANATSLKGGNAMLISDLPANSQIKNTIQKERTRHRKRFPVLPTLTDLISASVFSLLNEELSALDK